MKLFPIKRTRFRNPKITASPARSLFVWLWRLRDTKEYWFILGVQGGWRGFITRLNMKWSKRWKWRRALGEIRDELFTQSKLLWPSLWLRFSTTLSLFMIASVPRQFGLLLPLLSSLNSQSVRFISIWSLNLIYRARWFYEFSFNYILFFKNVISRGVGNLT